MTYQDMKKSLLNSVLSLLAVIAVGTAAADEAYTAKLSGVDCDGCKKTIARSLAKIEGVTTIRIVKNGDGTHTMTVTAEDGVQITEKQAAEAISKAEHYKIQSWKKTEYSAPAES